MSSELSARAKATTELAKIIRGESKKSLYDLALNTMREWSDSYVSELQDKVDYSSDRSLANSKAIVRAKLMEGFFNFVGFAELFQNVSSTMLLEKFAAKAGMWNLWVREAELDDFNVANIISAELLPEPGLVKERFGYRRFNNVFGELVNAQLSTYGDILAVDRQALLGESYKAFDSIIGTISYAYDRKISGMVYSILKDNPVSFEAREIFHADHNNVVTKTSDFTADLSKALEKMYGQKYDYSEEIKEQLSIQPKYVITSPAQSLEASKVVGEYNKALPDEQKLSVLVEPRLIDFGGWFLSAGKEQSSICLYRLRGSDAPAVLTKNVMSTDGLEVKHRWDFDVAPVDYRGLVRVL